MSCDDTMRKRGKRCLKKVLDSAYSGMENTVEFKVFKVFSKLAMNAEMLLIILFNPLSSRKESMTDERRRRRVTSLHFKAGGGGGGQGVD